MRIFAITRQGLFAIAISVGALWTSIAAESVIRHRAESALRTSLRKQPVGPRVTTPISRPARPFRRERTIPG